MSVLETARKHRSRYNKVTRHRFQRPTDKVYCPPPATGVNNNLVDKVEHSPGDRVIWNIIHSPEGSFTYDWFIKSPRRRRKRCPELGCHNFVELGQRKCIACKLEARKSRNRRHYQVLKERFKTASS
jgi:hypothetical protein